MPTKNCFKCGEEKPLSEFYRHPQMKDGTLNKCKDCTRSDATNNRWKNIERIREYDRKRGSRQTPEHVRQYRKKYPKKYKAQAMVGNAIRDGKMKRMPCEVCGQVERVNAHHDDYDHPLNVRWLCAAHHHQWHRDHGEAANPL